MFRDNERKEVFGLRKYKGYGLASAMIGVLMFLEDMIKISVSFIGSVGNHFRYKRT